MNAEHSPDISPPVSETGEAQTSPPRVAPTKHRPSGGTLKWFWWLVVIAMIALGSYTGQRLLQELQHQRTLLTERITDSGKQLHGLQQQLNTLQQHINDTLQPQLEKLQNQQIGLQETIEALHRRQYSTASGEWNVAEVIYLLQMAQQQLLLSQDTSSALAALHAADKRLMQAGDPRLLPIRDLLAKDLHRLRTVEQPDIAGMTLRLGEHADYVPQLPMLQGVQKQAPSSNAEPPPAQATISSWRDLPAAIWTELRSLIVIRHNNSAEVGLLSAEQRELLTWNLRLQLESARFSLLRRDTTQFHREIDRVLQGLDRHYDGNARSVQMLREDLQAMRQSPLRPELPDLSATVNALHQFATTSETAQTPPTVKAQP